MAKSKPRKRFDAVHFVHQVREQIGRETRGMTVEEQVAYFRNAARTGPFGKLWRQLVAKSPSAGRLLRKAA